MAPRRAHATPSGQPVERCYAIIGYNIAQVRKERGYSQQYVALLMYHSRKSISLIETGRERFMLHTVLHFAWVLRCPPKRLMKGLRW